MWFRYKASITKGYVIKGYTIYTNIKVKTIRRKKNDSIRM